MKCGRSRHNISSFHQTGQQTVANAAVRSAAVSRRAAAHQPGTDSENVAHSTIPLTDPPVGQHGQETPA